MVRIYKIDYQNFETFKYFLLQNQNQNKLDDETK